MATRVYLYLLLALHVAGLILLPPAGRGVLAVAPKIWLTGESFSVIATLDISSQQGDDQQPPATTWRFHLDELHSAWQLRSKVRFKIVRQSPGPDDELINNLPVQVRESGTFFADHEQLLVMNEAAKFCAMSAGGRELIDQLFTDDLINGFAHEKHLIGAGRLLYFVDANRDKFERTGNRSNLTQDVDGTEFSATLQVAATGAKFLVTLVYSGQVDETGSDHPQSITIKRRESSGRLLRFTFQRVFKLTPAGQPLYGPIAGAAGASQAHWQGPIGGGGERDQGGLALAFDLFALERAIGCAHVMVTPKLAPMDMTRPDPRGFTLTARVGLQLVREPLQVTAGYDPALYALRVSKVGATRTTDTLTNFRQNRCYYSTRRRTGATGPDLVLDSILQVAGVDSTGSQVESSTCVVVRASPQAEASWPERGRANNAVGPHTQGQLLLGADRLVYMGMARVRGIDANVYESYDSQLPVWLQAPAVYRNPADDVRWHWRVNALEGQQAPALLTSVFYFSRHGRSSDSLLLVEIFKSARPGLGAPPAALRKDTISIPIYDFAWRESGTGQARAPNGMRLESFYALGSDQCLATATRAQNQYARLDLVLESLVGAQQDSASVLTDWMREPSKRNLALMRALQEQFGVPSQFVYDLESRYQFGATSGGASVLPVTLRLAQLQETRSELQLLGRGQFRPEIRHRFRVFLAYSFQACHMIAAQRKLDLNLFLFDPIRSMCYLYTGDLEQLPENDAKLLEFLLAQAAKQEVSSTDSFRLLEAYKVVQESDTISSGATATEAPEKSETIEQLRERLAVKGDLYLTDPSLEPPPVSDDEQWAPARSHFKIVKFDLDLVDPKSVAQLTDQETGRQVESDSNKFPGFGLAAAAGSDELIHSVYAEWVAGPAGDRPGQMTYEQCQTACLASAECRSYSTCILAGQMQCRVSSVSFRSADLVAQLMLLERKPAKPGAVFPLNLNSTSEIISEGEARAKVVHVMRHPSCELHNKSYRKLFKQPARRVSVSLANRILRPVSGSEQCARMCFTLTWEFMREQVVDIDRPTTGDSSEMSAHIKRRLAQEAIADISGWSREYRASICDHFLYLDLDEVKRIGGGGGPSALVALKAKIQGLNHEGPTRGYCVVDKLEGDATTGGSEKVPLEPKTLIEAEQFEFNFLTLYEATLGLSLVESPKTDLEKAAYHSVSYGRAITPEELRALTLFLDRGDNSGQARPADSAAQCARECFQQLTGPSPWPACRSFSYMEVWHAERGKRYAFCLYNSITLRQAHAQERFDLVRQEPQKQNRICVLASEQVRIWHYDPKLGLVASSLDQVFHRVGQLEGAHYLANSDAGVHLGALGIVISLALILGLGVTLGIWLGNGYHLKRRRLSDVDQLVAEGATRRLRPTRVVFENAHHKPAD